ncbi:MAG: ABC transporter ATP-binding protein [Chloroflexi bacterium]|nr:ABC transporter ATP-binding protein [Chloroflexota bacterium]
MGDEMISLQHVWAGYGDQTVLEDITLSVREGDFIGIIGPNGGGKTTLLKVLLGLITPRRGTVRVMGQSVEKGRRYIGYVPQLVESDRDFPICVRDVVRMGRLSSRGLLKNYQHEDDVAVINALQSVDMLDLQNKPFGELSGGQRQRGFIARALVGNPRVLLLDEPTASVDSRVSANVYELLYHLNERVTIVMVSHDLSAISAYVKSVGCLNRRLFYHGDKNVTPDMLEASYHCPVDLIAHGVPHRVFAEHQMQEVSE